MNPKEQWKPIPGFPDYEVSNMGSVRSYKQSTPRILRPGGFSDSYRLAKLSRNGKSHSFPIGRLVLLAFRGPCPEGHEMCHNDGDPTNDHLDNLRWDTHAANMRDLKKHYAFRTQVALDILMNDGTEHDPLTTESTSEELMELMEQMMIPNIEFVIAVKREQERLKMTQTIFANLLGVNQSTLSKFYTNGVKDNVVIKILRKYPDLAIFFRSEGYVNEI